MFKGVIGPETSAEAEVMSGLLGTVQEEKQILQFGFTTLSSRLSNSDKFPNFVRLVATEEDQTEVNSYSFNPMHYLLKSFQCTLHSISICINLHSLVDFNKLNCEFK